MKKYLLSFVRFLGFFCAWLLVVALIPTPESQNPAVWRFWAEAFGFVETLFVTYLIWLLEKKQIRLHLWDNPGRSLVLGTAAGTVWLALPVILMLLAGNVRFVGVNSVPMLPLWLGSVLLNVVMQELLVRGYLYQMLRQRHNTAGAVVFTGILFTLLHPGAFEAGVIPVLNVFTTSLLMSAALEYTGSLIAPTVMHFLWNAVSSMVLGLGNGPSDYPVLMNAVFSGNTLLSGGDCKIEGSLFTLAVNVVLLLAFALGIRKQKDRRV